MYENNAISILSICHSYTNGWVDACSGGICFGYDDNTNYFFDVYSNNRELLQRMNGTCVSPITNEPIYREAHDAYESMPVHYDDFIYRSNSLVRLCPATKEYYPENNAILPPGVTSGFFETDTWCDATQPAWQALKLEFSNGDLSYNQTTDVYWNNPDNGKSNKIIYNWTGTHGNVTVKLNPDKIVAYGGGEQQLDFDGVIPNGEEGSYSFRVVNPDIECFTCDFSAWPSTSVRSGNSVKFNTYCSTGVTYRSWTFEGGNPTSASTSNPDVTYNTSGLYDVTVYATNSEGESFTITKNDYIYVYDDVITNENISVNCDYYLYADAAIRYYLNITYVPEGYSYDITLFYGDGRVSTTQTVEYPTTLQYLNWYADYGTYYPYAEVKLSGQDDVLFVTDCGYVDVVNPNPCGNFSADFNFYPEDPQPGCTVSFEPIIGNCSGNCYWTWEFATQASAPNYSGTAVWCNQITNTEVIHTFPSEGNYFVKLTAYETANGCPPTSVEKEVPVRVQTTCYDPINIYCSHYKPGNPIDRVLVRKQFCALELYWQHTINQFDQCQPYLYPSSAKMYLYRFGVPLLYIPLYLIKTSPYSTQVPWIFPSDYCYFTSYTAGSSLPFGRYVFKVDVYGNAGYHDQKATAEIDVDLVDCDLTATYLGGVNFDGTVINPPYYSSGKFVLNSSVNTLVTEDPTIFTACNGIILCDGFKTGANSFIATGYGFADCIQQPIEWWGNNYAYPDFSNDATESSILIFEVSPNPFRNFITLHLELSISANAVISLYGNNGVFINLLKKTDVLEGLNEFEFDLGNLPPGTYMLKVLINDSEERTLKITKQ